MPSQAKSAKRLEVLACLRWLIGKLVRGERVAGIAWPAIWQAYKREVR